VFCANEHPPAHFHAVIAEHRAVIDIVNAKITAGSLPDGEAGQSSVVDENSQGSALGALRRRAGAREGEPIK